MAFFILIYYLYVSFKKTQTFQLIQANSSKLNKNKTKKELFFQQ